MRRRSTPARCAGRTTSGTSTWPGPNPPGPSAAFERALGMRPDDVATLVWLGDMHLDRGPARVGRAAVLPGVVDSTAHGGGALRSRPGCPGATRVLARSRSVRAGAGGGSARVDRPLPARARLSRTGRHGTGRSAPASAGQRRGRSAGSVDDGAARTAAGRGGRGEPRYSRARRAATSRRRRSTFARASSWHRTTRRSDTSWNGVVADGRHARRVEQFQETVRRSPGFAQAHYSLGVLLGGERPTLRRRSSTSRPLCDTSRTMSRHGCGWRKLLRQTGRPDCGADAVCAHHRHRSARGRGAVRLRDDARSDETL